VGAQVLDLGVGRRRVESPKALLEQPGERFPVGSRHARQLSGRAAPELDLDVSEPCLRERGDRVVRDLIPDLLGPPARIDLDEQDARVRDRDRATLQVVERPPQEVHLQERGLSDAAREEGNTLTVL
jgi:hypothetical protein